MTSPRRRVRALVESKPFQRFIIGLILLNAVVLGLETSPQVMAEWGEVLHLVNTVTVGIFVVEIALRIYGHGAAFFRDGWNLFDLFVVLIALVPAAEGSSVVRILRILRVLRLLSTVRSMRRVVGALGAAIPGIASIGGLLVIIVYIFTVMATTLFQQQDPASFGNLGLSATSLFRIMLGDGWPDIIVPLAQGQEGIYAFFILFTIISTFIVLNLFIAVTVEALERQGDDEVVEAVESAAEREERADDRILAELAALREQVARLERRLPQR